MCVCVSSQSLLEEIRRGGVVDSAHQSLILTLCALGPQEINEVSFPTHSTLNVCTQASHTQQRMRNVWYREQPHALKAKILPTADACCQQERKEAVQTCKKTEDQFSLHELVLCVCMCVCAQVRLGPLTANAIHTLRHLKDFFGVVFNIRTEPASQTLFLSCVGVGYKNVARKTT